VRESTSKVGKGLYSSFWIQPFRGRVFHPVASRGIPATSAFFSRLIASEVVLLEENAAWRARLGDYSAALEYETSHVLRRIRNGEDKPIFLRHPFDEESARY
jgi:hypothetical protein